MNDRARPDATLLLLPALLLALTLGPATEADDLTRDQRRAFEIHDVTPEFIADLATLGYDLGPENLIAFRIHGVDEDYIRAMEDLGFLKKGEGGPWFAEWHSVPGGDLPVNTNGGGLSYTHTGMYGMFAIQESVRQLRAEAAAQVEGARVSVAHGVGGMFFAAGTLILTNDEAA